MIEYETKEEIICRLNGNNKDEVLVELLTMLNDRKITISEYKEISKDLCLEETEDIEKAIKDKLKEVKIKKKKKIENMNYLETKEYLSNLVNQGIKKEDLREELMYLWEKGMITGFDFRYLVEIMGLEVPERFLVRAKAFGRYVY